MLPFPKQQPQNQFNDYIIGHQAPPYKLLTSQQRSASSNSIYYQQNSLSRKKLTVISRDNSRPDFRGDYLMSQNASSLSSTNRTKIQNFPHSPLRNTESTHTFSQRNSQAGQSLNNSRVQRSKLKRPISPSPAPMTPTKILKLKRSMMKQSNEHLSSNNVSAQRSINHSISRRKFDSQATSPMKIAVESHRRMASMNNDVLLYNSNNAQNTVSGNLQNIKRELTSLLNLKTLQFQSKLQFQEETIKSLEGKLNENQRQLKEKNRLIEDLNHNRQRSKTFKISQQSVAQKQSNVQSPPLAQSNQPYLMKRINDLQKRALLSFGDQINLQKSQQSLQVKVTILQSQLITLNSSKLHQIKINLSKFLQQKSVTLSTLSESISYLDNKLIGRTQAIKETLCEIKQKVREVEDSWTHKDTKQTKESTTIGHREDTVEDFGVSVNKNLAMRRVENKLKEITSLDDVKPSNKIKSYQQGSLQFSLTSFEEQKNTNQKSKNIRNVYYDDNFDQMEDVSIGLYENGTRDDSSRLTDDFYYPGSTNSSSRNTTRNISPIGKKLSNDFYGQSQQMRTSASNNFKKKESPSLAKTPINPFSQNLQQSPQTSSPSTSQTAIRISNQAITKKIECIRQLIDNKKTSSCQEIEKGQLRCYVDKTGYLKYIDSKTFVFDKKGNLIPCTEGEFWFLVTKGLIYGSKREDDQSRTMSFVQYDC